MEWNYRVIKKEATFQVPEEDDEYGMDPPTLEAWVEKILNNYGKGGWELVSEDHTQHCDSLLRMEYILRATFKSPEDSPILPVDEDL